MTEQVTPITPEVTTQDAPTLSHADLQNAVAIIDHAAKEGAFKGWGDMIAAKTVRDKLAYFVQAFVDANKAAEDAVAEKTEHDTAVAEVGASATKGKRKTVRKG
jgi:hypothetical protein